jgi:hypothetical protein
VLREDSVDVMEVDDDDEPMSPGRRKRERGRAEERVSAAAFPLWCGGVLMGVLFVGAGGEEGEEAVSVKAKVRKSNVTMRLRYVNDYILWAQLPRARNAKNKIEHMSPS